jgi:23S rRNA pseudouridine1911/1915/1917 synthase
MSEPTILFEDESIVVVDKPSGMIVHPDGVHDYPALTDWLEVRYPGYQLVHRIDRETSGVLAVAKNEATHAFLKGQFQERTVRKVYRAFVYGVIKDERGVIDKPIGSARGGKGPRSARQPHGTVRDALTTYKVLARTPSVPPETAASYVEVRPKTGRTHQIRVHFAAIQRPIVHDPLYASGRPELLGFERLALHALSLTITLPNGGERTFEAPLPEDFIRAEGKMAL